VTLSLGSTCSKLGGQDSDPSNWRASVGGNQLEQPGTPHLCQYRVGDLLPVVAPWYGYCGRPMRGFTLMDPLGAQAVRRPGLLSGWHGKYVLGKFSR
jgi:hypothetical protein